MPAEIVTSTPASIYESSGRNFAPAEDLKRLAQNGLNRNPDALVSALQQKYKKYKDRDYQAFVENCRVGEQVANLQTGKMLLMRNIRTGNYQFVKREGVFSDNKTVSGKFQFYWTKLEAEWYSSRPELDPIIPSDDDQVEEYIASVKIIQDYYSKKFYNIDYEKTEFASAAGFGTYISRYRYCPYEKDIVCELLPFPACRWDIRFSPEESGYFIYESKEKNAVLEDLLGAELAADGDDTWNYGLQIIERLARTGGNTAGNGKERPYGTYTPVEDENTVIEMWMQPEEYCDIVLDQDTKTVSGDTLKKGSSLLEKFPKGMVVVGLNQMNIIWAIHDENHKEHIVSGVYHAQSFSGVGKGISDAVDAMKDLNDLHSQLLAHIKVNATPGHGYIEGAVSEEMARNIGKPRKNIPFNVENFPEGIRDIRQVVMPLVGANPQSSAFEYEQKLEGDLQMSMQVTDFTNGLPGVDNKTATGAKIGDANAAQVLVPQHLRKADNRRRGAIVTFNLFKKYIDAPKWFQNKTKNSITAGKYLTGTQFDGIDVDFEIVANSEIPQNPYEQKDSLTQMFQFTGGLPGFIQAAQMDPEMTGEVATAFGVKVSIPKQKDIARVCRKRVEQAKKILEAELQMQQIMTATTGIPMDNSNLPAQVVSKLTPPISPKEPYVQIKVAWLSELLDSDELQFAPPELRYVVEEMISMHLQLQTIGQAQVAQDQSMGAILANAPMLLGEQYLSAQNQELAQQAQAAQQQGAIQQQTQQQVQQSQMQMAQQAQQARIDQQNAEADHSRSLAIADAEHAKTLQLKNFEHQSKMQQIQQQGELQLKAQQAAAQAQAKARPKTAAKGT